MHPMGIFYKYAAPRAYDDASMAFSCHPRLKICPELVGQVSGDTSPIVEQHLPYDL
jgi:hypothetical protein